MNIIITVGNVGIVDQILKKRQGRLDPVDNELIQGPPQTHHAFNPVAAVDDQFADEAVVVWRNLVARINTGIDTNAETTGRMEMSDLAR